MPGVVVLVVVLIHAAVLGADLVAAQGVAREAARVAAVADDATVKAAAQQAAGRRPVDVSLHPPTAGRAPGGAVTATVRLRSAAFAPFGATVWLPAQATMRVEQR